VRAQLCEHDFRFVQSHSGRSTGPSVLSACGYSYTSSASTCLPSGNATYALTPEGATTSLSSVFDAIAQAAPGSSHFVGVQTADSRALSPGMPQLRGQIYEVSDGGVPAPPKGRC